MESEDYYKTEKRILVNMVSGLAVVAIYALYVYFKYVRGNVEILQDLSFWGKAFVILVPVIIVSQVIVMIIYAIVNKIRTNQDIPTITDERDKLIEYRTMKISRNIFNAGFFFAMLSQAVGMKPVVLILVLIAACAISGLSIGIVSMTLYRRGG